jgi:hypothetical protein
MYLPLQNIQNSFTYQSTANVTHTRTKVKTWFFDFQTVLAILKGESCDNIESCVFLSHLAHPQLTYIVMRNLPELKTMFPLSKFHMVMNCLHVIFHNLKKRNKSHSHSGSLSLFPSTPLFVSLPHPCLSSRHLYCCKTSHLKVRTCLPFVSLALAQHTRESQTEKCPRN